MSDNLRREPVYVFGHRNPDTDSIVSAMAYAALQNALGNDNYQPARLGHLNDETSFLLEHFGFQAPVYLHTVRTQVRDIDFDRPPLIDSSIPMSHAWQILQEQSDLSAIPVKDEEGRLVGLVTAGAIAESDMESIRNPEVRDVPIYNLLSALEGKVINDEEDVFEQISGRVHIHLPQPEDQPMAVSPEDIWICGEDPALVDEALAAGAACVIICQSDLAEKYRGRSSATCLICTPCDAYRAARMLYQSIPVSRICTSKDLVAFHLDDYLDDVRDTVLQSRFRAYPVLDEQERVVGTLSRYHLIRPRRKKVVLVDHNESAQSVEGLEQAEIMAILDHHRLADVQTANPVFMRNEPVGSTTSIVASMYQEVGLMPPTRLAGLMVGAILSDTVLFKSPTCTPRDRRLAERLARIAGIDIDALGKQLFSSNAVLDKPVAELLKMDFKEFHLAGHSLGIGQATCLDTDAMLKRLPEILPAMSKSMADNHYDMQLLMLTDVLREGTELIFQGDAEIIRNAFNTGEIRDNHVFLPHIVSRKKQIVPALALLWG